MNDRVGNSSVGRWGIFRGASQEKRTLENVSDSFSKSVRFTPLEPRSSDQFASGFFCLPNEAGKP